MHLYPQIGPALHNCLSITKSIYPDTASEDNGSESSTSIANKSGGTATLMNGPADIFSKAEDSCRTDQNSKSRELTSSPYLQGTDVDTPSTIQDSLTSKNWHPQFVSFPISEYICYKENPTFSHHLVWTCFRNGYQLLSSPFTEPESIKQVFGPRFGGAKRQRMEHFLGEALLKLHTQLRTVVDATTLQTLAHQLWHPSPSLESGESGQELLDACGIQNILREREIPMKLEGEVSYDTRSSSFDMKYFIERRLHFPCHKIDVLNVHSSLSCSNLHRG
jgi:hypothetical protein